MKSKFRFSLKLFLFSIGLIAAFLGGVISHRTQMIRKQKVELQKTIDYRSRIEAMSPREIIELAK